MTEFERAADAYRLALKAQHAADRRVEMLESELKTANKAARNAEDAQAAAFRTMELAALDELVDDTKADTVDAAVAAVIGQ